MALTNDDKQRIREEEAYRDQVRQEMRTAKAASTPWKTYIFWTVLVAVALLLYLVVRSK
jgi:hypothetical protein